MDLKQHIRNVPDFPKPGIMFRDITPLLAHPKAFKYSIDRMADEFRDVQVDAIMAAEARGFIFATPLCLALEASFIPVRKPGKLPFETEAFHYDLEYGSDSLEIHTDALQPGQKVLMIDDLLATGGTVQACIKLAEKSGAEVVGCGFAIELTFLNGRERLDVDRVFSLISYDGED